MAGSVLAVVSRSTSDAWRAASPVWRLLAVRVPLGAVSVALVGVLTYLATQVRPGDAATAIRGQSATPERLQDVRAQLGLDEPVLSGMWHWFGSIVTGDFGTSLAQSQPVPVEDVVFPGLANSV